MHVAALLFMLLYINENDITFTKFNVYFRNAFRKKQKRPDARALLLN